MKFFYFNSTHWDREWYMPFQRYRHYLVETADGALKALEDNPALAKYTFDGQTIILEDILEIHPEWRERFVKQIAAGRLNVGPWYVMPDEFLVSGESLIRNLLIGHELAADFGGSAWPVGYICDIFGHVGQMPQIFRGFGIDTAVIWRGTDSTFPAYFSWESPDGTCIDTLKLPSDSGYASFSLYVTGWWDRPLDEAAFKERLQTWVERSRRYFGDALVLSDALDHINAHSQAPQYLEWIKEVYPDAEVVHCDYRELAPVFRERAPLPVIAGELIKTADIRGNNTWMIPHTLSSRYDIKAAHDRCQNLLEIDLDMLQAHRAAAGAAPMTAFWKHAWKLLVKNQPHDSICGCSIDAVHRQMLPRFEEIAEIGDAIRHEASLADRARIAGAPIQCFAKADELVDRSANTTAADGRYLVRVYNPLPWERDTVVDLDIAFPAKTAYPEKRSEPFGYEFLNNFKLYDAGGAEVPYQFAGAIRRNRTVRFYRHDSRNCDIYPVAARLKLAAAGWTSLEVRPETAPARYFATQATGRLSASNGRIELAVNPDGSFDLVDRGTGRSYRGLNAMVIDREIGDGWNAVRPVGAATGVSGSCRGVALRSDGPARTVFEIVTAFEVPRELEFQGTILESYGGIAESCETATLVVKSTVSLDAADDLVRVRTRIDNNVKDYRLRMVAPTGVAGKYFAYQNFAFLERAPGRETGDATQNHLESEPLEKNFSGIAGKFDGGAGLAVIARYGLHEIAASERADGELYVTLLRAFRRTVATDGEIECQLLKELEFEYAFQPLSGECDYNRLWRAAQEYRSETLSHIQPYAAAPAEAPWLRLDGGLALAALKPAHSGEAGAVIVRLVNLSGKPAQGTVRLARPARVTPVDLAEQAAGEGTETAQFTVAAEPWRLLTYKLEF